MRYPRTRLEYYVTILLAVASLVLLLFLLAALYKCACSRNYAKWRTSLMRKRRRMQQRSGAGQYYTQTRESVPLILSGHTQV